MGRGWQFGTGGALRSYSYVSPSAHNSTQEAQLPMQVLEDKRCFYVNFIDDYRLLVVFGSLEGH